MNEKQLSLFRRKGDTMNAQYRAGVKRVCHGASIVTLDEGECNRPNLCWANRVSLGVLYK